MEDFSLSLLFLFKFNFIARDFWAKGENEVEGMSEKRGRRNKGLYSSFFRS
jgi:phosphorylcholine metabolism protein LicD